MHVDPYILAFSGITVVVTIGMGFWAARKSKTAHDFFVAGRSVSVGWNASAISGEYLSAASFMGVAGMVMSSGYDALWYPVCYACGYLFLLLFIAGPLRRFGAYTIPDFAEGRFDSPVFRKIAVVFVLFIGFFYTMPQMKGAGTTLAYIFPGLPYWAGVVVVGAVITLNVALGGMKGITLVQAFQYWAKMFAISVPIFVLMAIYGHYGDQLAKNSGQAESNIESRFSFRTVYAPPSTVQLKARDVVGEKVADITRLDRPDYVGFRLPEGRITLLGLLKNYGLFLEKPVRVACTNRDLMGTIPFTTNQVSQTNYLEIARPLIQAAGFSLLREDERGAWFVDTNLFAGTSANIGHTLPEKAPRDRKWLSPFGPLTTKAAKAAAVAFANRAELNGQIALRDGLSAQQRLTLPLEDFNVPTALFIYAQLTDRTMLPTSSRISEKLDDALGQRLSRWGWVKRSGLSNPLQYHNDGLYTVGEVKARIEEILRTNRIVILREGEKYFWALSVADPGIPASGASSQAKLLPSDQGDRQSAILRKLQAAWLQVHERPLALLYTYSLIIALVCGTAGLPHILVRFYTNPDGVAAKRTTMWVMILIGVFYIFPPVFGALGRNLLPDLYAGTGAKGTDKIVLELPRILNDRFAPLGSILSGITCAGAFAAFMSTFSGLLVSMTGALAHDVYGRILRPRSTPQQRMKAFKICAVIIGGIAIGLGMQVEQFQINFMVGQAFAIAAASYFPLLFMSAWWRGMTMKGAATGMLAGGLLALAGISLTSFSDLKWLPLDQFWAGHPLFRILCEQPAIWAVPLALTLMVVVSKLTRREIPADIRIKMLVLHAPEQLGLKQEYIQEHQAH
jgi:Na+(H+)/acetate symporter ActP